MAIATNEAKKVKKAYGNLKAHRGATNQQTFWGKYGVTQSGGSRYESGREMDKPLRALMALHISGAIDDATLDSAMKVASSKQ